MPSTNPARTRHTVAYGDNLIRRGKPLTAPLAHGLVLARHRLAAQKLASNLARIAQIHAASLHHDSAASVQAGPDKQETPRVSSREVSTDLEPSAEVPGGCSTQCA